MTEISEPIVFEPYLRPQIWGGRNLERLLHKKLPAIGDFGESWEISAHPHHVSRVGDGPHRGVLLTDLWSRFAAELTGLSKPPARFPLLIKLLDCRDLLSIQVHPNDESAQRLVGEEWGKTEAWVILAAEPTARIFAGLRPGVSRQELEAHMDAGTTADCLHSFTPKVGECLFLPAGTVHAVGGGVVMAEVQQSSDATFRLFDWNRPGADGRPRALHRRESLESIDWSAGPVAPVVGSVIADLPEEIQSRQLVLCKYFVLEEIRAKRTWEYSIADAMSIWMTIKGEAELSIPQTGFRRMFRTGQTVLTPAGRHPLVWTPQGESATLLRIAIP